MYKGALFENLSCMLDIYIVSIAIFKSKIILTTQNTIFPIVKMYLKQTISCCALFCVCKSGLLQLDSSNTVWSSFVKIFLTLLKFDLVNHRPGNNIVKSIYSMLVVCINEVVFVPGHNHIPLVWVAYQS